MKRALALLPLAALTLAPVTAMAERELASSGSTSDLDSVNPLYDTALPPGYTTNDIVGVAIAKSNNRTFVWYRDGKVSSGSTFDMDSHAAPYSFTCPPGKSPENIVAVAISSSNKVYTWWDDKTVSVGQSYDLDEHQAPQSVTFPQGQEPEDLKAVAISASDRVYAFWRDNTKTKGYSRDLAYYEGPQYYYLPWSKKTDDLVDIAISNTDRVYAWYHGLGIGESASAIEDEIDALVEQFLADNDLPGATVAVSKGGRLVHNKGYGFANIAAEVHMKPYHRSRIGSISKVMTTMGVFDLIESTTPGDFSLLDDPLYTGVFNEPDYHTAIFEGVARHKPIVAMAISKTDDHVFTWYDNGTFSEGRSWDLDYFAGPQPYSLPNGKTPVDIRAIAFDQLNNVVTFYDDKLYTVGSPDDLNSIKTGDFDVSSTSRIMAIACDNSGKFHTWNVDGTKSVGTREDLEQDSSGVSYSVAQGRQPYHIRAIGIAGSDNDVYAWYSNGTVSRGSSQALSDYQSPYDYTIAANTTPADNWFDWYNHMTLRDLMNHAAGINRSRDRAATAAMFGIDSDDVTYEQLHLYMLRTRKLTFAPGTDYSYSNYGAGLIGLALENLSAWDYHDYLQDHIFEPIGIHVRAAYEPVDWLIDSSDHKMGDNGPYVDPSPGTPLGTPEGGWIMSAGDLVRFALATDQLVNRTDVLNPNTLDEMESDEISNGHTQAHGWALNGAGKLSHSGGTSVGRAYIAKWPNGYVSGNGVDLSDVTVAVLVNSGGDYSPSSIAGPIAEVVGDTYIPSSYDVYDSWRGR